MPIMGSLVGEPSKLYTIFQELHIATGKLGNNEISAWHDSFNKQKIAFLDWFQTYINSDNCLTYSETIVNEEIVNNVVLQSTDEYKMAVQEFESKYPGIFDLESNSVDCEFLEFECEFYTEELKYLEKELSHVVDQYNELKQTQSELENKLADKEFKRDEVASTCLHHAELVDLLNVGLGRELTTCSNIFMETHNEATKIRFLCEINLKGQRESFFHHLEEVLGCFTSEIDDTTKLEDSYSTLNLSVGRSLFTSILEADDIECSVYNNPVYNKASVTMRDKMINIFRVHNNMSQKIEICNAQMKYLQGMHQFKTLPSHQSINNFSDEIPLRQNCNDWEASLAKYVDDLIQHASTAFTAIEEAGVNSQIETCKNFEAKFNQLIEYQRYALQLYKSEAQTFDQIAVFMNDMRTYVADDLQQCEARDEGMKHIITEYDTYISQPIENKWHLLGDILKIINVKEKLPLAKALEAIKRFEDECNALERRLYIDDLDVIATELQTLAESNKALVSFLSNKATDELHVIPHAVNDALQLFVHSIAQEDKELKHAQGVLAQAKHRSESTDKWTTVKSQLWMYFLKKPEKVELIIEDIQRFVTSKRAAFLNS